jgi:hypothetical protein
LNLKRKAISKRSLKKRKEKKETLPSHLSAQPGLPAHLTLPAPARLSLSLFFFFPALADTWAPPVSLSLSPFLSSSPLCLAGLPPQPRIPPRPASPHCFPSSLGLPIKSIKRPRSSGAVSLPLHRAVMAAAINGKRRRSEPARLPSPSSLCSYLSPCSNACASLCLPSTPTRLLEPNSPVSPPRVSAAAVQSSPPVKDNLRRPYFLLFGFTRGS